MLFPGWCENHENEYFQKGTFFTCSQPWEIILFGKYSFSWFCQSRHYDFHFHFRFLISISWFRFSFPFPYFRFFIPISICRFHFPFSFPTCSHPHFHFHFHFQIPFPVPISTFQNPGSFLTPFLVPILYFTPHACTRRAQSRSMAHAYLGNDMHFVIDELLSWSTSIGDRHCPTGILV